MKRINVAFLSILILVVCEEMLGGYGKHSAAGSAATRDARAWTYIDIEGNVITDRKFDKAHAFSEGLAAIRIGDKVGYIDRNGAVVIEPVFCDGGPFTEGLAYVSSRKVCHHIAVYESEEANTVDLRTAVFGLPSVLERMLDRDYGFIDATGKFMLAPRFGIARPFREGYALIAFNGKWRYVDKQGNFLPYVQSISIVSPTDFSAGLAATPSNSNYKWLFWNTAGKVVFETLNWAQLVHSFSDGFAKITNPSGSNVMYIRADGRFLGEDGESGGGFVFEQGGDFSEGLAPVKSGRCWHYINKAGQFPFRLRWCLESAKEFSEGLAAIEFKNKQWGFLDKTGKLKITPTFEEARKFSEGLAAVKSRAQWGYIDKDGRLQIKPSFIAARDFSEGRAAVLLQEPRPR